MSANARNLIMAMFAAAFWLAPSKANDVRYEVDGSKLTVFGKGVLEVEFLRHLAMNAHIEELIVDESSFLTDRCFEEMARLPHLRKLEMAFDFAFDDEALKKLFEAIGECRNLSSLAVFFNEAVYPANALDAISHLKKLKLGEFEILGFPVNDEVFQFVSAAWPALSALTFQHDYLTADAMDCFAGYSALSRLSLELMGSHGLGGVISHKLGQIESLTELMLIDNSISDEAFAGLGKLPHLEKLHIGSANIGDGGLIGFSKASPSIHWLILEASQIQPSGLASIANIPNLRHFALITDNAIPEAELRMVMDHHPSLRYFYANAGNIPFIWEKE